MAGVLLLEEEQILSSKPSLAAATSSSAAHTPDGPSTPRSLFVGWMSVSCLFSFPVEIQMAACCFLMLWCVNAQRLPFSVIDSVGNLELMKQIQERQLLLVVIYRK